MSYFIWALVAALVGYFGYWSSGMAKGRAGDDGLGDMGLAIVDFGRAFPGEAIRTLRSTKDHQAAFVRLHDNKAGFMQNKGSHFSCHLIEPGTVRVRQLAGQDGFAVEFLNAPNFNGEFIFPSAEEAAEVSLWLLGNYTTQADLSQAAQSAG